MNAKAGKISLFLLLILAVLLPVGYFVFSEAPVCKDVVVEYADKNRENRLLEEFEIKQAVEKLYPNVKGMSFNDLDMSLLERTIRQLPGILDTDVYRSQQGILYIRIESRVPVVRVMPLQGKDFFIDQTGELIPARLPRNVRVPIASGHIDCRYDGKLKKGKGSFKNKQLKEVYKLAMFIYADSFLKAQIEQIYFTADKKIELVPKVGKHIVMLGTMEHYKKKLKNLKKMYLSVLKREGWNRYSYLNFEYKNQVVCTKRDENN